MKGFINGVDFHELEPQKYWSYPSSYKKDKKTEIHNMVFSNDYIGSRKMDGAFFKFLKDEDGNMELCGRSKSVNGDYLDKIAWVPQLHEFFSTMPNGTCLLGEIYFPNNEGSHNVTTIMGCLCEKALQRQEKGDKLHYYVFDVLAYDNVSYLKQKANYRFNKVKELSVTNNYDYLEFAEYLAGAELWDEYQRILSIGGEGVVITKVDSCYQPGKRPARQTLKLKKELTDNIDVIIIGANPPKEEYTGKDIVNWKYWQNTVTGDKLNSALYWNYWNNKEPLRPITRTYFHGWAGSLKIGLIKGSESVQIGSLSGLEDTILENWRDYIGKVAEISAMEIYDETAGIRHPRFIRWRPDKDAKDCTWETVYGNK